MQAVSAGSGRGQIVMTTTDSRDGTRQGGGAWIALWTSSHCEHLVHDQLASRGFETFLPEIAYWGSGVAARVARTEPLFPGYLFLRHALDKASYVEIVKTRGLVRILGQGWDRPAVVPDREVDSIRRLVEAGLVPRPHPWLREGRRVRVRKGPLRGAEGILLEVDAERGLLVLSIDLFQRSVAVEIDCALVAV
jgi:transcription antitermination factor NusG